MNLTISAATFFQRTKPNSEVIKGQKLNSLLRRLESESSTWAAGNTAFSEEAMSPCSISFCLLCLKLSLLIVRPLTPLFRVFWAFWLSVQYFTGVKIKDSHSQSRSLKQAFRLFRDGGFLSNNNCEVVVLDVPEPVNSWRTTSTPSVQPNS